MNMTIPNILFKYEPINEYSLSNLKNATIYFNAPNSFNDPYDCSLSEASFNYNDNDLVDLYNYLISTGQLEQARPANCIDDIPINFEKQCADLFNDCVKEIEYVQRHQRGCTCFTKNNRCILMWAHYADKHKGMCLEFDATIPPFDAAKKVNYSYEFPVINPIEIIIKRSYERFLNEAQKPVLTKFECWKYEAEWRLFHKEPNKLYGYPVESLKAVYFGVTVDDSDLDIACRILHDKNKEIKFYRAQKNKFKYKIDFDQIEYTPHVDSVNVSGVKP